MRPNRGAPWCPPHVDARWVRFAVGLALVFAFTPHARAVRLVDPHVVRLEPPDFIEPTAVAADPFGKLYVADVGRATVMRVDTQGRILFEFESPAQQPDLQPVDLETTGFQVYVIDAVSNALLRFSDRGSYLDVLQSFSERRRETPRALAVDAVGRVLLAHPARHEVTLLDEAQQAETQVGGFGSRAGELASPSGVAFAPDGAFYVADADNARVQVFSGVGNWVATLSPGVKEPRGLVVGRRGVVFVADASGAVHAFSDGGRTHTLLEWPDAKPIDVAVHGDTLWILTREPAELIRVRIVRGD